MHRLRPHRKVFLWWGGWWAVQLVLGEVGGFGIRPVLTRPLLDLYLGPLTLAIGRDPYLTEWMERHRESCRGFLIGEEPVL